MLENDPKKRFAKLKAIEEEIATHGKAVDDWCIYRARRIKNNTEVLLLVLQGRGFTDSLIKELAAAHLEISTLRVLGRAQADESTLLN